MCERVLLTEESDGEGELEAYDRQVNKLTFAVQVQDTGGSIKCIVNPP